MRRLSALPGRRCNPLSARRPASCRRDRRRHSACALPIARHLREQCAFVVTKQPQADRDYRRRESRAEICAHCSLASRVARYAKPPNDQVHRARATALKATYSLSGAGSGATASSAALSFPVAMSAGHPRHRTASRQRRRSSPQSSSSSRHASERRRTPPVWSIPRATSATGFEKHTRSSRRRGVREADPSALPKRGSRSTPTPLAEAERESCSSRRTRRECEEVPYPTRCATDDCSLRRVRARQPSTAC